MDNYGNLEHAIASHDKEFLENEFRDARNKSLELFLIEKASNSFWVDSQGIDHHVSKLADSHIVNIERFLKGTNKIPPHAKLHLLEMIRWEMAKRHMYLG